MLVCTFGDLTLDVIVKVDGPIARGADTNAVAHLAPGGQAANVAAWAADLGARARYIGKRGADDAGALAARGLEARMVEVAGPAEGRGGIICSLVDETGERSMLSDRGTATDFRADELEPAMVRGLSTISSSPATRSCASLSARLRSRRSIMHVTAARG